ncbi:hypothetical protein ONS95_013851 [Cadophora gregata]|uniref:uncharacterized protein n=1 Tax=Cadophora gregata TaxID=51156 RepID=UPI0026DD994B|nr:uncharacterized protein ONS95_013851 [Cadophora gregata]KAK0114359.1 hypothetical protein ONS95_013851 [Cadophora gregata]
MAHNYVLQVTAGSEYDIKTHKIVPVNQSTPITIDSEHISVDLNVRIQSYRGLPPTSPSTSPYFSLPEHSKANDQYSIAFRFTPKSTIKGDDLVFGNDFDHPIRDRLPPGFNTAFRIVKWVVDPGLDGDVYADRPYLYGPAASSVNKLHVGPKAVNGEKLDAGKEGIGHHEAGMVFEEGGDEEGLEIRKEKGVPETEAARKKHFLVEENRKEWEWEEGRVYGCDFYNPYLDFNDFALRLPGFTLPIMNYWDGQGLRYTLKNRATDTVLFVVLFTLYLKEDVDENGNVKEGVEGGKPFEGKANGVEGEEEEKEKEKVGVEKVGEQAVKEKENEKLPDTSEDDVD